MTQDRLRVTVALAQPLTVAFLDLQMPTESDGISAPAVPPAVFFSMKKFVKGCDSFSDIGHTPYLESASFEAAFSSHYSADAHFVTYISRDETGAIDPEMPRCNKTLLPHLRLRGGDLLATMIVLDWDTEGHVPLTPAIFEGLFADLVRVGQDWPTTLNWTLLYTTRNGCRFVYVLSVPVPVDVGERIHRGLAQEFQRYGIKVDGSVSDWTRLFRLPYVVRDKVPTWGATGGMEVQYLAYLDNRLDPATAPTALAPTYGHNYADVKPFTDPKPDDDEVRRLLTVEKYSGAKTSPFYTEAKRRLRGRDCFGCIFEVEPLATAGNRDTTIQKYAGQVVSLLYGMEEVTAAHVYALLHAAVVQLEPDPAHRPGTDWTDILWGAVGRNWAKEEAKREAEGIEAEERGTRMLRISDSVSEGMTQWCPAPELTSGKQAVKYEYVARRLIAIRGMTYYLVRPDGFYDSTPFLAHELIPAIRARGLEGLIETRDEEGADLPVSALVNKHGTSVIAVQARPADGGGWITDADTNRAILQLPAYWRNTALKPEYNADVDNWLKLLGGAQYGKLLQWIGHSLNFEGGCICALSIKGRAGSGKKMLAQGLAECLGGPKLASSVDLVGDWNYALMETPFLVIDEGWVKPGKGRHPADQFRALVAGEAVQISRKYQAPVEMLNPLRIVFTANNHDAIRVLTSKKELSPQDREALMIRLFHISISDDASKWLSEMGGMAFTARQGQRWIRGDGGEASDYIVAKHFLHLHAHRNELGTVGGRFLVEGNHDPELLFELRTQSGASPVVLETILRMLESGRRFGGLVVDGGRVWVSAGDVLEFYRRNLAQDNHGVAVTIETIHNVIKGLALDEYEEGSFVLDARPDVGVRHWVEIDTAVVLSAAQKGGWPCEKLRAIRGAAAGAAAAAGVVAGSVSTAPENRIAKFFTGVLDMSGV